MRRTLTTALGLAVLASGVLAQAPGAPAGPPDPDVLAEKALQRIEERLRQGETGWWKGRGEPALNFLGAYTGLESDVATVLAVGDVGEVFPAWNPIADQIEVFGIGCSVYTAIHHAAQGRGDKAILSALKDFAKYRLSKIGAGGALYASGVGLIDFSLNYFGESVMQSNTEKFYALYCGFHAMKHPSRTDYLPMIREGGFDALAKELDTYWDARYDPSNNDWDPTPLGGFGALTDQDPDYREHFRARFIREELMPVLEAWAGRELFKARAAVIETARRLAEETKQAKIRIVFTVLEERLDAPPAGYTAEIVPANGQAPLATVPVAGERVQLEVPLTALRKDGRFQSYFSIVLKNTQDPKAKPRSFSVDLRAPRTAVEKKGAAGVILFEFRKPFLVSTSYPVQIHVTGSAAAKVGSVSLLPVTAPRPHRISATTQPMNASRSVYIKNGAGGDSVAAGRYLLQASGHPAQGPVTVSGPCTINYAAEPASSADATDPASPSANGLASALTGLAGRMKGRGTPRAQIEEEGRKAYEAYWTQAAAQFGAFRRAVDGWRAKYEEEVKPVEEALKQLYQSDSSKPEVKAAIEQRTAQRDAMRKARDAKEKELETRRADAEKELQANLKSAAASLEEAEKDNREERKRRDQSLDQARKGLNDALSALDRSCRDARNASETVAAAAKNGSAGWWPSAAIEAEMEKVREAMAKTEASVAQVQSGRQTLGSVVDPWRAAAAAVEEIGAYSGDEISPNLYLLNQIDEVSAEADAVLAADLVTQGKAFLAKCGRTLEHRRARMQKMAALQKTVEEAAGRVPVVDAAGWASTVSALRPRADALFGGLADPAGADDTAEWKRLSDEIENRVRQERERIGDRLEGAEKSDTAFSGLLKAFRELLAAVSWSDMPPDWFPRVCQPAFDRFMTRDEAIGPFLDLRRDVRKALALGGTRAARGAALKAALGKVDGILAGAGKGDPGARLDAVRDAGRELEKLPRKAAGDRYASWDAIRMDLARGGAVEAWARGKGVPFLCFTKLDEKDYGKAFFWPEAIPPGDAQHTAIILEVKVEGIPEDGARLVQVSYDGGGEWMPLSPREGIYTLGLPRDAKQFRSPEFRLQAILPGNRRLPEWEFMPLVRFP